MQRLICRTRLVTDIKVLRWPLYMKRFDSGNIQYWEPFPLLLMICNRMRYWRQIISLGQHYREAEDISFTSSAWSNDMRTKDTPDIFHIEAQHNWILLGFRQASSLRFGNTVPKWSETRPRWANVHDNCKLRETHHHNLAFITPTISRLLQGGALISWPTSCQTSVALISIKFRHILTNLMMKR